MKRKLALLLFALLLCLPLCAGADSFEITDHHMLFTIDPDGAGLVRETLQYTFDDTYNGILVTLRHEDLLGLTDLSVYVDGNRKLTQVDVLDGEPYTYTATTHGEETELKVYAPGGKGVREFRLSYRLGGLAQRYSDTARINHVLLDSATKLESVTVQLQLPGRDGSAIQAFVHGAMDETQLSVSGGTITLGPGAVGKNKKLEIDVLFPEAWLSDATTIDLPMLEEALAVEAEIAAERAAEEARAERIARIVSTALLIALPLYAIVSFAVFLSLRGKYGLKHTPLPVTDDALLSEMTAAEGQALYTGSVDSTGLTASLVELVDMGILSMETGDDDTVFTRVSSVQPISPHLGFLLGWLFGESDTLSINSLDAGDDVEAAGAFTNQYNAWKNQVVQDVYDRGWWFKNEGARVGGALAVLFLGLALSFFLMRTGAWALGAVGIALTVLLTIAYARLRKRTDTGDERMAAMLGFLQNYEDVLLSRPETILVHIPLLMALGYLKPLAAWIDEHPQAIETAEGGGMPIWLYAGMYTHLMNVDNTVREAQSHNLGTQSGGDGGSSSGGGFSSGSGGGNSYGAW